MGKKIKEKFQFDSEFQEAILRFTVTDNRGYKALQLYDDQYFELLHHAAIAFALKKYYKKKKRVPEKAFLKETIRSLYTTNADFSKLTSDDRKEITDTIELIFSKPVQDGEGILEKVRQFAQFVNFKAEMESIDVLDFNAYATSVNKLQMAINIGKAEEEDAGILVVGGIKSRAHNRKAFRQVIPTPIWQLNQLMNAGGLAPGSLIMILGEAKRFKTGAMLNFARLCMRRKLKVAYYDFENSKEGLTVRSEQGIAQASQEDIINESKDDLLIKIMQKFKRLGAELYIQRLPAYTATAADIEADLEKKEKELGIKFDVLMADYPDIMAAISGNKEEVTRISDVYIDLKNLLERRKFLFGIVPSHTKANPQAQRHRSSRYTQYDIAKCIDKIRHVDLALGLQESEDEMDANIIRFEVIEVRNGRKGKMLFWVDWEQQKMTEFKKVEVKDYNKNYQIEYEDESNPNKTKEFQPPAKHERKKSKDL